MSADFRRRLGMIKDETMERMMEIRLREMEVRDELCNCVREVQARKIWKQMGYGSLQDFCEEELGYDALETRSLMIASNVILLSKNLVSEDPDCQTRIEKLKTWRREKSAADATAAFRVLSNRTLLEIAKRNPKNMEELLEVRGVGNKKRASLGEEILALLNGAQRTH